MRKTLSAPLLGIVLASCTAGPDYAPPRIDPAVAGAFAQTAPGIAPGREPEQRWWRSYEDPSLDALIDQALIRNTDLRIALANLKAVEAVLIEARNARLPQTSTAANTSYGRLQPPLYLAGDRLTYGGGVQLAYEVDLLGRVSRTIEAARADADAQSFVRAAVQIRVVSAVASAYLTTCNANQAIAAIQSSIALSADNVRMIKLREQAGSAARFDVVRAEAQLAESRGQLAPAENARVVSLLELAALLGLAPSEAPPVALRCQSPPEPRGLIATSDGVGLLRRRPDVAEAERRLAAATARIGVATADLYPRITIGGNLSQSAGDGVEARRGFSFGLGPALSFSFPNLGAARARVRRAKGLAEASLAAFDGVVLSALKEVEQALSAYRAAVAQRDQSVFAEHEADEAYRLAQTRYRAGSVAYTDVLVAQSELLRLRLARIQTNRNVALTRVDVFRSLGSR